MAARRGLPDNLDPLVDTLSNVVGILVIVVALTQIQLGDALSRVAELDRRRIEQREGLPDRVEALDERRSELVRRTDADVEASAAIARELLAALEALPASPEAGTPLDLDELREEVEALETSLATHAATSRQRGRYAQRLESVPKRLVARLPDPQILRGKVSWLLVRYGRVYLVDREALYEEGIRAIRRILPDGVQRQIRRDEFETLAHYMRKRPIGTRDFRWALRTDPPVRGEIVWRSREAGIDATALQADPRLQAWLAARSPDEDIIEFHVWSDSFETYLAAREVIEAAGFRAGWEGHEADEELAAPVVFGGPRRTEIPVQVD